MDDRERNVIAAACHSAARALAIGGGKFDSVQWEVANGQVKHETLKAVDLVLEGAGAEQLHEVWCEEMRLKGWKVLPPEREVRKAEPQLKLHPNLVPFDELPHEDRIKATIFVENVHTMARALNPPVDMRRDDSHSPK